MVLVMATYKETFINSLMEKVILPFYHGHLIPDAWTGGYLDTAQRINIFIRQRTRHQQLQRIKISVRRVGTRFLFRIDDQPETQKVRFEQKLHARIHPYERFTSVDLYRYRVVRDEDYFSADEYKVDENGVLHSGESESESESADSRGVVHPPHLFSPTHSGSIPSGAFDMPAYRAPSIEKSHFRSSVKTGSRSLHSSNYTGSGSHKKLRNGILQTELENTASSHPKMVYVKGDPTRLLAPLESWKRLPGQLHPLTRQPLGHSDLRKVKNIASSLGVHKTIGKKIIKKRR